MRLVTGLFLALAVGSAGLSLQSAPSRAQAWPQRTVRVIVPLPPGTPPDISARIFAEQLSVRWKQPVIIENIVGADGILAGKEFASRHDDHTLLYSFAGLITINPLLYEKLPYDPKHDLVPIAMTTDNFSCGGCVGKIECRFARRSGEACTARAGPAQVGCDGRPSVFRLRVSSKASVWIWLMCHIVTLIRHFRTLARGASRSPRPG